MSNPEAAIWANYDDLYQENLRLRQALAFYADPETYIGVAFLCDSPGEFAGDFEEPDADDPLWDAVNSPKPGKRAREALRSLASHVDRA